MKKLFFILLAVVCMAGCAYPSTADIPRTSKPLIETSQVVVLARHGCWGDSNIHCKITVKNLGPSDVRNVEFLFKLRDGRYESAQGIINYLPARETIDFTIGAIFVGYDPIRSEVEFGAPIVVEKYEIVTTIKAE